MLALACIGAAATPGLAQTPPGWQAIDVPVAQGLVYAVRFHGGYRFDPAAERGVSRILAECRLRHAKRTVPAIQTCGVVVEDGSVVAFVAVPPQEALQAQRFVAALLEPATALPEDQLALIAARVALTADNAAWLYPGQLLASRARGELSGGVLGGLAGDAAACLSLRPSRLRNLLAQPAFAAGLVMGKLPPRPFEYLPALPVATAAPLAAGPHAAEPLAAAVPQPAASLLELPHPRADGPFAAIAFAIPASVDRTALAVGFEVARARAARTLPPRREELSGRAPRLLWSWLADDAVAVACRRGPNGAPAAAPLAELEAWLTDLSRNPPTAEECHLAVRSLQQEFWLPPGTAAQQAALASPAALAAKAVVWLQAASAGRDPNSFAVVTAADANAALQVVLTQAPRFRAAAVPASKPKFGSFTTGH